MTAPTSDSVETLRSQLDDAAKHIGEQRGEIIRLKQTEADLRKVARELSILALHFSGGGSEMFKRVAGEFYADAEECRKRGDHRIEMMQKLAAARAGAERTGLVNSSPAKTEQNQCAAIADELVEVGEGAS